MLRLRTLGGLDLSGGTDRVNPLLSQPKRLALLVYLSASSSRGFRRRDAILPLFWPELNADRARNALRQAMYVLRRDLGPGVILARGEDELGVDGDALWVDAVSFERAVATGDHRQAAELYRGDFLDGFFVSSSGAEFDEWVAGERRRLRELASRVMLVVAEDAVTQEPESAAGWIRKGLALAPDNEVAVRQALDRLIRIGDHAGALHLFHEFRERLEREYTAEPATETKALAEAIRSSRDPGPVVGAPQLAGRDGAIGAPSPGLGDAPSAAGRPSLQQELPPTRSRPWLGTPARWALVVLSVGALSLSAWGISRSSAAEGPRWASGGATGDGELLVGDVEARPEDTLTAHALTEVLRTKLADSRVIRVVPRTAIEQGLARAQLAWNTRVTQVVARDLAVRNGYEVMLTSQLMPVGSGYVLSAHLTTVGGQSIASISESASSPDALISALGRLIRQVRSRLGESQESLVAIPPLQQVTTSSIRALELFTQAQDLSHVSRGRGQQPPEMMKVLREALAIDSTFAMAHRRIGAALHNLGLVQEAAEAFRSAERFSHKLSDLERLTALVSLYTNLGEYDRALGYTTEMMRLPQGSGPARTWRSLIYFSVGQYDVAEQEYATIGPIPDVRFWSNLRTYQGRGADAVDSARAFQRQYGNLSSTTGRIARRELAVVHASHFAYDSAIAHAVPRGGADSGSLLLLAASRFARGEAEQALAIQSQRTTRSLDEPGGRNHAVVESYSALAQLLVTPDRANANRRLDGVLADTSYRNRNPANRHIRPVLALALAGRARDARREFEAMVQASSEDVRVMRRLDFALARGAIALAERRVPEAIAAFVAAGQQTRFSSTDVCRVCTLPWLGRAYEAAGQFDSAAVVYERYLTTGDPLRVLSDGAWRARILQRLGDLHAQRGDTALAVRRLQEFAELWKDADRVLQPDVTRARHRLLELRSGAKGTANPDVVW